LACQRYSKDHDYFSFCFSSSYHYLSLCLLHLS
jgi:hypothetical protein